MEREVRLCWLYTSQDVTGDSRANYLHPSCGSTFRHTLEIPPEFQPSRVHLLTFVMAFRKPMDQEPRTFFPPLAMQESVWDSIVSGDFINAKIFAFSRRSRKPGRVDTPKAIFVNTRVLETACSYFQSSMSPPPLETFSNLPL